MAGGTGLSSFISGFGMGQQALDSGANLELKRDAMRMEREKYRREVEREEGRKRALGLYAASLNEKGESDFDNPEFLNRMLQSPAVSKAVAASFTEDSPAGEKGYTRVPVALEPAVRQAGTDANGQPVFEKIPGKYAVRVQWRDADGKVVSEGPATENGTNDPNDRVVEVDAKTAAQALFSEIGAYAPELLPQITAQRERKRDLSALQTLSTLKPIADGGPAPVQAPGQPAGAAPRTAPRAPAPSAQAAAPAEQTPAAAPVEQTPAGTPADKARFVRLRDKMNNELKAAGDELAAVMAPASDANHQGARQAKYEQDVQAAREKIAQISAQYQQLHKSFGVPFEGAVPATVAPDKTPNVAVDPERIKTAAAVSPANAQAGLSALQAATRKRGTPKLNDEQKDALAWLTARGKISAEQYDRAMRTGRLSQSTKKMVSDGVSGLWVMDDDGTVSHINGPYTAALVAAKGQKKGAGSGDAEKDIRDFLNFYYPGDKEVDFKRGAVPQVAGLTSVFGKQLSDEGMHGVVSDAIEAQRSVAGKFSGMIDSRVNGAPIKSLVPYAVFRQTNTPIEPALDRVVLPVRKRLAKELGTDDVQLSEEEWAKVALATARGMNAKMPDNELVNAIVRNVLAARGK